MAVSRRKPDSPWSWLVCFASFVTLTFNVGSFYSFGLLMPSLMQHFRQSNAITAWAGALYISLAYMFAPLVTRFIERFGFRLTASCGALLFSSSFIASSFVDNFWLFFVLFSMPTGLGSAASYHCAILVALKHFVKWRSLVAGVLASTSSVGLFVMTQITEAILSKYGLQNAIRGWALLFFLTVPLAFIYGPRDKVEDDNVSTAEENTKQHAEIIRSSVLRNGPFTVYLVSISLVFSAVFTPQIYMVRFCEIELGIPADRASLLYTYMAIAAFFSNHFFCKLSEIKLKYVDIFDLYQLATTCFGICLLLLPLARSYKVMVALSVLFGLMDGGRYGLMPLVVLECVGQKRTDQAWGYLSFGVGFASAIGPTFIGFIADSAREYGPAFFTAGGIMVFGSTLVVLKKFKCTRARNAVAPEHRNTTETPGTPEHSETPEHTKTLETPEAQGHRNTTEHRHTP